MFFKNVMLYQITQPADVFIKALRKEIPTREFIACKHNQVSSCGFVPPDDGSLFHEQDDTFIFRVKLQERKIPTAAVRELMEEKVATIEADQQRKVYRKERIMIKDEIVQEQIPHILPTSQTIVAYIDARLNMVVVDTASPAKAESVLNLVREAIGSFPVLRPQVERAPTATMTDWILNCPNTQFALGTSCVIEDPAEGGVVYRITNEDLESECVEGPLREGMRIRSLAVEWDEQIDLTLIDPGRLKKLQFSDELIGSQEQEVDGEAAVFNANMAIMTGALRKLIPDLGAAFGGWVEQGFMDLKEAS